MHSSRITVLFTAWLATVVAMAIVGAQAPRPPAPSTPHAVVPGVSHDFGVVVQGGKLTHQFVIRNTGGVALTLSRLSLSQRAMSARMTPAIPPGGEGVLSVEWDTAGLQGAVEGSAVLEVNDPDNPRLTFLLKADVKPAIEFTPFPAVYASLYEGESARRHVRINVNRERPLDIVRLEQQGDHFQAAIAPVTPARAYDLEVTVPATVPPGRYSEAVYLYTDDPQLPRLMVPVNVLVKRELYFSPEIVDFGVVSLGQLADNPSAIDLLTQTVVLRKRAGRFSVTGLTSDLPFLSLRRSPDGAANSEAFRVDVALSKGGLRPGPMNGTITVLTDDKQFGRLVLAVRGEIR